jgi:peptidoglycan/xylan/chitin deacetylase (PgdA/CDA1 family)
LEVHNIRKIQTNGPKEKNANGAVTTTHARHLPQNNIENMDTLYNISQYNKQHTKAEKSNTVSGKGALSISL